MTPRDWAAGTYHRVSAPHLEWADAVLGRLELHGDETVLDAGCGSGRVTLRLLDRLPRGRVVAVDASPSMVEQAREVLAGRPVEVVEVDLIELELPEPVDGVFSSAVFHWVLDHDALFARLHAALRPGGRLVAQCGGRGNIAGFRIHADAVSARPPYAEHLADLEASWNFAEPHETETRLRAAGFPDATAWLEPWPVSPPEPAAFISTVCLGPHLDALPDELRERYVADVIAEAGGEPLTLDYVRLNIEATRA